MRISGQNPDIFKSIVLTQADTAFAPVVATDAKILILGSFPGQRSLVAAQYYAHSQNAFWKIVQELYSVTGDYEHRSARQPG